MLLLQKLKPIAKLIFNKQWKREEVTGCEFLTPGPRMVRSGEASSPSLLPSEREEKQVVRASSLLFQKSILPFGFDQYFSCRIYFFPFFFKFNNALNTNNYKDIRVLNIKRVFFFFSFINNYTFIMRRASLYFPFISSKTNQPSETALKPTQFIRSQITDANSQNVGLINHKST